MIDIPVPLDTSLQISKLVKSFPTKSAPLLFRRSYFNHVVHYIQQMTHGKFLEIGYRKGIFVEVCKVLGVPSVHLDISDKLLRASPTKNNVCLLGDSLKYLESTSDVFHLIFQDGSKGFSHRWREYELIADKEILSSGAYLITDDLHYSGCRRAFDKALKLQYEGIVIDVSERSKKKHKIGIMKLRELNGKS